MSRIRSHLLKATAAVVVIAALAACDAPSGAFGPRDFRAPRALRDVTDSTAIVPLPDNTTTTTSSDEETCRSGYHIAYRDDGTWSCEPDVIDTPPEVLY
jgi:hypothetical protein